MPQPEHLIIVCCHAIWAPMLHAKSREFSLEALSSRDDASNTLAEDKWLIAPFQKGETPTFIKHIVAGIEELGRDEKTLLIFSG
jgi:hypothetical protein